MWVTRLTRGRSRSVGRATGRQGAEEDRGVQRDHEVRPHCLRLGASLMDWAACSGKTTPTGQKRTSWASRSSKFASVTTTSRSRSVPMISWLSHMLTGPSLDRKNWIPGRHPGQRGPRGSAGVLLSCAGSQGERGYCLGGRLFTQAVFIVPDFLPDLPPLQDQAYLSNCFRAVLCFLVRRNTMPFLRFRYRYEPISSFRRSTRA